MRRSRARVKRADSKKPAEQVRTIEIAGAANPTWASVLPRRRRLAAAGAAAAEGGDAAAPADAGDAPADDGSAPADGEATGVDVG